MIRTQPTHRHTCQHVEGDPAKGTPIQVACRTCRQPLRPRTLEMPVKCRHWRLENKGTVLAPQFSDFRSLTLAISQLTEAGARFDHIRVVTPDGIRLNLKAAELLFYVRGGY